ncbi:MAG TPA: cytochrome c [Steroidobacteraceae bacterium]|nr:cytochrome c [Steroidobacteraceae bacterium]
MSKVGHALLLAIAVTFAASAQGADTAADQPTRMSAKKAADAASVQKGREVFQYWCTACHGDGPGKPGTTALQTKYNGKKPALLEARKDLTPALTKFFVRNGISVMPPFRKTEITDADLSALAAYLARPRR